MAGSQITSSAPGQRPSIRDSLTSAWDRIMAPSRAVMPPARPDLSQPGVFNAALTQSVRGSAGLPTAAQAQTIPSAQPDPITSDYTPGEAFKIGAGAPMGEALDFGRQVGLNARYLAAAMRRDPTAMAALGAQVDQLKDERALNELAMQRLAHAQPTTMGGYFLGNIFSPSGMPESWLPKLK